MHSAPTFTDNRNNTIARFGHSHGYRLEGDSALLNAQIDVSLSATADSSRADSRALSSAPSFALQLWACDEPYAGGPLSGFKIAEAPIALSEVDAAVRHDAVAFVRPPASTREYSMVLVLAAGTAGSFDQVYDFANYPERQRFIVPHIVGAAAYKLHDDGSVSIKVDRVVNPRAEDNLSGSLALQLWAREQPYTGGELTGTLLAARELGQVRGQDFSAPGELRCPLTEPAPNATHVVLALCEWTSAGYLARDYCNFVEPMRTPVRESTPVAKPVAPSVEAQNASAVSKSVAPSVEAPNAASASKPAAASVAAASTAAVSTPVANRPAAASEAAVSTPVASKPAAASTAAPSTPVASKPATATAAAVSTPVASEPAAASVAAARAPEASRSINTISEAELIAVAGISKKLAAQVIKARPFKSFDELRALRGIGDSTVQTLRKTLVL